MRLALVEWTQGGHHELHLRTAATALADAGHEVWILFPDPVRIRDNILTARPELADRLKPFVLGPHGRFVRSRDPRLQIAGKWLSVRRTLGVLEDTGPFDLVFFMYLDEFLAPLIATTWLDAAFRYRWAGIYMQPLYRLQNSALGRRPEFLRRDHLLRSLRFSGAMVLDEVSIPWLEGRFNRKFVAMPEYGDIADPDLQAPVVKELQAFADGRPIVCALGSLSRRKGILNLVRAAAKIKDRDFVVAIAGKLESTTFSPEELVELDVATTGLGDRCWYRPEPIDGDGAFAALMSLASAAYLAYEDWVFSSGLQSIAARFEVPCIVADAGIMADRARDYGIGLTIAPTNPDQAAEAIQELLAGKPSGARFADYCRVHSKEQFEQTLCNFVTTL